MKKYTKGQTLIELTIVLALMGIIISAITISVIKSLSAAQLNKNKNLATQYVQEGMELIRDIKDRNFSIYDTYPAANCLDDSGTVSNAPCDDINVAGIFTREVLIEKNNTSKCDSDLSLTPPRKLDLVTVRVTWNDAGCTGVTKCQKVEQVSCLSNIYVPR